MKLGMNEVIGAVIAITALVVSLPTIIANIVTASETTGADASFAAGLTISQLVLGFGPALLVIAYFVGTRSGIIGGKK